ncbi:hypothetical protein [Streptomyces sp. TN58]|uniref:hypothetical protein n=1 Tax=Streptomyces sp. TN58 TaxID=234612 RepID=UPI001331ACE3|nr:hypothetical protein [Streptomyces sp. TN58]
MLTKRPSGTHFSQSSATDGQSPLARDDGNTLNTHAVLFNGDKAALAIFAAGAAVTFAVVEVAPHVKNGLISLKSKLSRRAEDPADKPFAPLTVVAEAEPEQPEPPRLRAV